MPISEKVRVRFLEIIPKKSMQKIGSARFAFNGVAGSMNFVHSSGNTTGKSVALDVRAGLPILDLQ